MDSNNRLSLDFGTRIEWQSVNGDWYTAADRKAAGTDWVSGNTTEVKKIGGTYLLQQAVCIK